MSTYEHRYESPDGKAVYVQQFCLASSSTISTNATCSDNPGPGRVLDNLFQFLGRKLELAVGKLAHKAGYGPDALSKKLAEEVVQSIKEWEEKWKSFETETLEVELSGKGRKLSERLMKHVQYVLRSYYCWYSLHSIRSQVRHTVNANESRRPHHRACDFFPCRSGCLSRTGGRAAPSFPPATLLLPAPIPVIHSNTSNRSPPCTIA